MMWALLLIQLPLVTECVDIVPQRKVVVEFKRIQEPKECYFVKLKSGSYILNE